MHLEQINLLLTMIACWQLINSSNSTFSEIFKQVLLLSNKMKPILHSWQAILLFSFIQEVQPSIPPSSSSSQLIHILYFLLFDFLHIWCILLH